MATTRTFYLATPDATEQMGARLGRALAAGDVVLLEGPIGAGKTHLARAIITSRLDAPEDVPSPTFTLVQTYQTGQGEIWHADLYRLTHPDQVEELGLIDAFEEAICLVEWPDRLGSLRPDDALTVHLAAEGEGRRVTLAIPDRFAKRIAALSDGVDA